MTQHEKQYSEEDADKAGALLDTIKKAKEHLAIFLQDELDDLSIRFMVEVHKNNTKLLSEEQVDVIRKSIFESERDAMKGLSDAMDNAFYEKERDAKKVIEDYEESDYEDYCQEHATYPRPHL